MKKLLIASVWMITTGTVWVYGVEVAPKPKSTPATFPQIIRLAKEGPEKDLMGRDFIGADAFDIISIQQFAYIVDLERKGFPFIIARSVGVGEDSERVHYRYYPVLEAHDFIFGTQRGHHFGLESTFKAGIRFSRYKRPAPASNLFGPERFEDDIRGYMIPPLRYYVSLNGKSFMYFASEKDITEASGANAKEMRKRDRLSVIFSRVSELEKIRDQIRDQDKKPFSWGLCFLLGQQLEENGNLEEALIFYAEVEELVVGHKLVAEFEKARKTKFSVFQQYIKDLRKTIDEQKKAKTPSEEHKKEAAQKS
ncbi:MAG: hypothetical protein ACHQVS_00325 [Candidatus Babeliales bacterium]